MPKKIPTIPSKKCKVFFDFDNTIATCDVFDDLVLRFSQNHYWRKLEKKWREGKIGSLECLAGQLKGVKITKQELDKYLRTIRLDPAYSELTEFLHAKKVETFILSDNFAYMLKEILKNNSLKPPVLFANQLGFNHNKLIPGFPFQHKACRLCAHCKTKNLLANAGKNSIIVYIGDGRSDICPARHADIIFAKSALLDYCRREKISHVPFRALKDVTRYLEKSLA